MKSLSKIASRVAKTWVAKNDAFEAEEAIKKVLLQSGWKDSNGKIQKRVKSRFETFPKLFTIDSVSGKMLVKGQGGKIVSKVDLSDIVTRNDIQQAAKALNDGVVKVASASNDEVLIRVTEDPNTVVVVYGGKTHKGEWDDNQDVFNAEGDEDILKAAMMAWSGEDQFTLTPDELEELGGGFWSKA